MEKIASISNGLIFTPWRSDLSKIESLHDPIFARPIFAKYNLLKAFLYLKVVWICYEKRLKIKKLHLLFGSGSMCNMIQTVDPTLQTNNWICFLKNSYESLIFILFLQLNTIPTLHNYKFWMFICFCERSRLGVVYYR